MPRSVNNVDFGTLVIDSNVLGKNGDTTLALQIVVVQNQFALVLVVTEQMGSVQHFVHKRCFAVVNVRNNCNISYILHNLYFDGHNMPIKIGHKITKKKPYMQARAHFFSICQLEFVNYK